MTEQQLRREWLRRTDEISRAALTNNAMTLSIACLARCCVDSALLARNFGASVAAARLPNQETDRYWMLIRRVQH